MPIFEVEVNETLARRIPIKASNEFEAMNLAEERYYNSQVVLDAEDLAEVRFYVFGQYDEKEAMTL